MANISEISIFQKERLFDLLLIEKHNTGEVKGLNKMIRKAKATMSKEDIAYVVSLIEGIEENEV